MSKPTHDIDIRELNACLARQGKFRWEAASQIGVGGSTFSHYLSGRLRAPPSLRAKLEQWLQLEPGTLRATAPHKAQPAGT